MFPKLENYLKTLQLKKSELERLMDLIDTNEELWKEKVSELKKEVNRLEEELEGEKEDR